MILELLLDGIDGKFMPNEGLTPSFHGPRNTMIGISLKIQSDAASIFIRMTFQSLSRISFVESYSYMYYKV